MKKLLALLVVFVLIFSLCACSKPQEKTETEQNTVTEADPGKTAEGDDIPTDKNMPDEEVPEKAEKEPEKEKLRSTKYIEIIRSKKYTLKARVLENGQASTMTTSVNGADKAMDANLADGTRATLISKGGKNYIVDYENQIVMVTKADVATSASGLPAENLNDEGLTYYSKGTGTFAGKSHEYELYKSSNGDVIKFFYDGNKLIGMETPAEDGSDNTLEIQELSAGFDAKSFELPANYPQFDLSQAE